MDAGIHVRLRAADVESCPVASTAERVEVESVVTDLRPTDEGVSVVGEMTARAEEAPAPPSAAETTEVFSDGSRSVYRFDTGGDDCPCGRIPRHGCPVRDVRAASGTLRLRFVVPDLDTLKAVVSDLRSCCGSVEVRQLVRSTPDEGEQLLVVDRSAFTDRQYDSLATAHEMGYFARPREATAADVAAELGVSTSTFGEHLSTAQSKLMDQLFRRERAEGGAGGRSRPRPAGR